MDLYGSTVVSSEAISSEAVSSEAVSSEAVGGSSSSLDSLSGECTKAPAVSTEFGQVKNYSLSLRRSISPNEGVVSPPPAKKLHLRTAENIESSLSRKHEIEGQALECLFGLRTEIDSEELLVYLLKNKVKNLKWIKQHANPKLIAKTLTPELFISAHGYSFELSSLPFTCEQYLAFAEQGIEIFDRVPEHLVTDDFFIACLKKNPKELGYVDRTKLSWDDPRITPLLSKCDSYDILCFLPKDHWPDSLILEVVIKTPSRIEDIPDDRSDYSEILQALLKKNAFALSHIPVNHLTNQLVDLAVSGSPACNLCDIPLQFLTKERCKSVILNGNKGTLLEPPKDDWQDKHFNIFERHPELADLAIDCQWLMRVIPNALKTEKLVEKHLQYCHGAIAGVPPTLLKKNKEWCEKAVKFHPSIMEYVPDEIKDYQFCLQAVQFFGKALKYIPQELLKKHPELVEIGIKNAGVLYSVPKKMRNEDRCTMAVCMNPQSLEEVPKALRQNMPLWVLASEAPECLPERWQQHILEKRDTCYLPNLPSSKLSISRDTLLNPIPPNLYTQSPFFLS